MKSKICLMVCVLAGLAAGAAMGQNNTALFNAIRNKNPNDLRRNLQSGWDINRPAADGKTALMLAVELGWRDGVEMIVNSSADINGKGSYGENPVLLGARVNEDTEILKYLIGTGKANLDARDDAGDNILIKAVRNKNPTILRYLLDVPTLKLNMQNADSGKTALMIAIEDKNTNAVQDLLKKNLDLDITDREGNDALKIAINTGNSNAVGLLLNKSVDFETKNSEGRNALMLAIEKNNVPAVKVLVNKVNLYERIFVNPTIGDLPLLLWACNIKSTTRPVLEAIMEVYIEPLDEITDSNNRTAHYYARLSGNQAALNLLESKELKINEAKNTQR